MVLPLLMVGAIIAAGVIWGANAIKYGVEPYLKSVESGRATEIQTKKETEVIKAKGEAQALAEGTVTAKINEGIFGIGGSQEYTGTGKAKDALLAMAAEKTIASEKPKAGAGISPSQGTGLLGDTGNAFAGIGTALSTWGTVILYAGLIIIAIMIINMVIKK